VLAIHSYGTLNKRAIIRPEATLFLFSENGETKQYVADSGGQQGSRFETA